MKVRLIVAKLPPGLVHETTIPLFNEPPRVILWRHRVYLLARVEGGTGIYSECSAYTLPSEGEHLL